MGEHQLFYVRSTVGLFTYPQHGIHIIKNLHQNPFIKNLVGTKNCYLSETERNEWYSTSENLSYPIKCINIFPMITHTENKVKTVTCKLKYVIISEENIVCASNNLDLIIYASNNY